MSKLEGKHLNAYEIGGFLDGNEEHPFFLKVRASMTFSNTGIQVFLLEKESCVLLKGVSGVIVNPKLVRVGEVLVFLSSPSEETSSFHTNPLRLKKCPICSEE